MEELETLETAAKHELETLELKKQKTTKTEPGTGQFMNATSQRWTRGGATESKNSEAEERICEKYKSLAFMTENHVCCMHIRRVLLGHMVKML